MHLVSSDGVTGAAQQSLFMPMMTRMPKARVKMLVVSLSPNAVPGAVLRQNGVPVYDVALSKNRFSAGAFGQLVKTVHAFKPDVIQAWGHTADIVSTWVQKRAESPVKVVWSIADTAPLRRNAGLIDRQKLKYAAKFSKRADKIVYTSEAAASAHRRAGFPEGGHAVIPLGVDPTRFKPDFAARRKVREQLGIAHDAFVLGMVAPFQPEYDHTTLLRAVGELIKTNPNIVVLLAGHGVQKGNAPLMALVGGGTLGTRTQLLGEWSDMAALFNACDLACSSALTDSGRMSLVMAMLCGVPCVATGMGAQGEVIGQFGVAVEPGSPAALIRGITRVLQMPPDKRVFMAQGARKHALTNFVSIRSLQKYLQLYYDVVGRKLAAATAVPAPEIDATIPTPSAEEQASLKNAPKPKANRTVDMYELRDPDSLESRDLPTPEERAAKQASEGDVLNLFESNLAKQASAGGGSPMSERARGVADDHEDLLAPELLSSDGASPVAAPAPNVAAPALPTPVAAAKVVAPVKAATTVQAAEAPRAVPPSPPAAQPPAVGSASPLPAAVADTARIELTLADTMSLSMQMSSTSMTGTLEIPPDLIFMTQVAAPTPAKAAPVQAASASSPDRSPSGPGAGAQEGPPDRSPSGPGAGAQEASLTPAIVSPPAAASVVAPPIIAPESVSAAAPIVSPVAAVVSPESTPAVAVAPVAEAASSTSIEHATQLPVSLPTPSVVSLAPQPQIDDVSSSSAPADQVTQRPPAVPLATVAPVDVCPADSSTVPAIAVDALLSATPSSDPVEKPVEVTESVQLDLLGEPVTQTPERVVAG